MTVAELKTLLGTVKDDVEVQLHVAVAVDEGTYQAERVPLDAQFKGWAECANCGAVHKYGLVISNDKTSIVLG